MLTLSRSLAPTNLLTVAEWLRFAKAVGRRSWRGGVDFYCNQTSNSACLVLRADDSLMVFARHADGRVHQKTYRAGSWGWAS